MLARENPFSTDRILKFRYRLRGKSWDELLAELKKLRYRAAIVGPEGSGKTTLLEDLNKRLKALGFETSFVRVRRRSERGRVRYSPEDFGNISDERVFLIDGAGELGLLDWARLKRRLRKARGVVITSHSEGRLPTLIRCETEAGLLRDMVQELAREHTCSLEESVDEVFHRHNGNVRTALLEFYDLFRER